MPCGRKVFIRFWGTEAHFWAHLNYNSATVKHSFSHEYTVIHSDKLLQRGSAQYDIEYCDIINGAEQS